MTVSTPAPSVSSVELRDGRGTLSVCAYGDPEASPLLLLHGGGLNGRSWQAVCATLVEEYYCIAPDLLGHGDSTWSKDGRYSIPAYAADVADLVNAFGLPRLPVVGHSLGGLVGTAYAADSGHPSALVLVDVGLEARQDGVHDVVDFMKDTSTPYESLDDLVAQALRFNRRRDPKVLRQTLEQNMRQLSDGRWRWKYDQRFFPGSVGQIEDERVGLQAVAARVRCPVLVLRGEESTILSPEGAVKTAARFVDAHVRTVSAAAHTPHGDNPAGFLDALLPFLRRLQARTEKLPGEVGG
jgi:pimeloyl-ACP methyl ester carboxylesterase